MLVAAKREDGSFGVARGLSMQQVRDIARNLEHLKVPYFYGAERDGMAVKYGSHWTSETNMEYNNQIVRKYA